MSEKNRWRLLILISVICAFFTSYRSYEYIFNYGIGLSPDSLEYILRSQNLYFSPTQGPWYSFTLFFGKIFSIETEIFATFCNMVALFLSIVLSLFLTYRLTLSLIYPLLMAILIYGSFSLFYVSVTLWSETIYILFNIIFFYFLSLLDTAKRTTIFYYIVLAAIFVSLSFLQRLMGVIVIGIGALYLYFYFSKTKTWNDFGKRGIRLYFTITLSTVFLWTVYMKFWLGYWWFYRPGDNSITTLFWGIINWGNTLSLWTIHDSKTSFAPWITFTFYFLGLIIFIFYIIKWRKVDSNDNLVIQQNLIPLFLLIYAVSTITLLIYQQYNIDIIDSRLASVIYIPLTLLLVLTSHQIFFINRGRIIKFGFASFAFGISLTWIYFISFPLINTWSQEPHHKEIPYQRYLYHNQDLFSFINYNLPETNCYVVLTISRYEYDYFYYPKCEYIDSLYPETKSSKLNNGRTNYLYVIGMSIEKFYQDFPLIKDKFEVNHFLSLSTLKHILQITPKNKNDFPK